MNIREQIEELMESCRGWGCDEAMGNTDFYYDERDTLKESIIAEFEGLEELAKNMKLIKTLTDELNNSQEDK